MKEKAPILENGTSPEQKGEKKEIPPMEMYLLPGESPETFNKFYLKYREAENRLKNPLIMRDLILKALLDDEDWDVRRLAVELAKGIEDEEVKEKVLEVALKGLNDPEWVIRRLAVELAGGIEGEEAKKIIILKALGDEYWVVRKSAIELAGGVEDERIKNEIILKGLDDPEWVIRKSSIKLAGGIEDEEVRKKVKEVWSSHFKEYSIGKMTKIYKIWSHKDSNRFGDRLNKNGSETILLDRIPGFGESYEQSFKTKIIMRRIKLDSFLAWKKAFDSYDLWKSLGYDYVPVEPILYFTLNDDDLTVNVYTAVLDMTVSDLELEQDPNLSLGLAKLNLDHGHFHAGNTCTYFERDENGNLITNRPPRQYIIDFDRAKEIINS
ncbi:MAG: hypothetical protein QG614_278 [Patescibacteria group bacterium]|nr:hypothetical protein [Patescibacteria group bacterium]